MIFRRCEKFDALVKAEKILPRFQPTSNRSVYADLFFFSLQSKSSLEKQKTQLLDERDTLQGDLKDMTSSFQESDKRRKNAESALSEAQSRISEDTSCLQELGSLNDKMKVREGCPNLELVVLSRYMALG